MVMPKIIELISNRPQRGADNEELNITKEQTPQQDIKTLLNSH